MSLLEPPNGLFSSLRSVSALVFLATDDSNPKPTFEQMIKKQIAALRKQLDETETKPSALRNTLQEPVSVVSREPHRLSQAHDNQIAKDDGRAGSDPYERDMQHRAKAAVAYCRSFIA